MAVRAFHLVISIQSNQFRVSQGKKALKWHESIAEVCLLHATEMGEYRAPFSHDGFNDRIRRIVVRGLGGAGENLAMNNSEADPA